MEGSYRKLGELLVEKKLITKNQLNIALRNQKETGERLGKILVDRGWVTEDELLNTLSEKLNIPKVKLDSYIIDSSIIDCVPYEIAVRHKIIPLFKVEDTLTVAMVDPFDVFTIDALRYHTGCRIQEVIAAEEDIEQAIEKYYSVKDSMEKVIRGLDEVEVVPTVSEEEKREISVSDTEEASVIKLVNLLISQAIKDKASDIHIESDATVLRVRYRIDGVLQEAFSPPKHLHPRVISRIKIMADMDVSEKRIPQDGRFRLKVEGKELDIRVSVLPTVNGEKVVMRILDQSSVLMGMEELGFSEANLKQWRALIRKPEGIILITGPTGSGKTTLLYAMLNEINSVEKNIVTVENPVEYKFPLINQVQVNPKAGLTFAMGLRAILRQDPDIIMIGEIRDLETAEIAIRSALTGHLVFSTLHTNDASGAVVRLIDMGIEPFLVASSLVAVMSQRLVRKICLNCKQPYKLDPMTLKRWGLPQITGNPTFYNGTGCRECKKVGYKGRTGIHESMIVNDEIRKLIIKRASSETIKEEARNSGMLTLREDGLLKASQGITTIEEVMRVS